MRPNVLFSTALAAAALTAGGCGKKAAPPSQPTPTVTVATPVAKKITDMAEYTGRLAAIERVDVRPRVSGYIVEIPFKEGDMVKKGDLLFVIDPRPYEASLGQSNGQLKEAQASKELNDANFQRAESLQATKVTSKSEYDTAVTNRNQSDAKVATAQAAVDAARLNLGFTRIASPIEGRVSRVQVTVGNLVAADSTVLTNIVSIDPVYAYADVDERTVIAYKQMINEGKVKDARDNRVEVAIAVAGEKSFPHKGAIDFVDNQINAATGTLSVRGKFDNAKDDLLPGMFIRMQIPVSAEHDSLLVTERAIGSDQGQKFVLVVKGDKVETRPVTVGNVVEGLREIKQGIAPDDQVIINGVMKARPGSQVKIERGDMAKFASGQLALNPVMGGKP